MSWLDPYRWLLVLGLGLALSIGYPVWRDHQRGIGHTAGAKEVRAEWTAAALVESEARAKETFRRISRQKENQDANTAELTAARAAADRNAADADRVRSQATESARQWAARIADSPTGADLAAAAEAIAVCTDLLGRADRAAGILAAYADAARIAGLQCERDYTSLNEH